MKGIAKIIVCTVLATTLMGSPIVRADQAFKDVNPQYWAYDTIEWAVKNKITNGFTDGTFRPTKTVTEEEFLAMLLRAYTGDMTNGAKNWSDPYYDLAKKMNYPVSGNRQAVIDRTKVAEIIVATQGKNFSGGDAIVYMLGKGLAQGKTSATVAGYAGSDTLTRAEAVQFIKNVLENSDVKELLPRPTTPSSKDELPLLPFPKENQVGEYNADLEAKARVINTIVAGRGYSGRYNGDDGVIFLKDLEDGINFMSYSDRRGKVEGGTIVVSLSSMMYGEDIRENRLAAALDAMAALGLPADSKLEKAIRLTLSPTGVAETVEYSDGTVIEVVSISYGRVILYVEQ